MRDSFNYADFCKCAYTFKTRKSMHIDIAKHRTLQENPAWRIPPYLAHAPTYPYPKPSE